MARTNKGADGKPLTYAEKNRERILNGEEARTPEEIDELDKLEVQDKILNPEEIKIKLLSGEKLCVRKAVGPADVKKRRVMDCLGSLVELIVLETAKLSGDSEANSSDWFHRNQVYLVMASKRFNIQMITVETVNAMAQTSYAVDDFDTTSLMEATLQLFRFYLEQVSEVAKTPKNDKAGKPAAGVSTTRS
jgi:hypothetical protein